MLRHLLVPLDGSNEAESALAVAAPVARRTGAFVTLLHVLEPEAARSTLIRERDVQAYLAQVVRWLEAAGVSAARLIRDASPSVAATIALVAAEMGVDLMVLSSRGAGKAHGMELGRLAREALVSGTVPLLLVRPFAEGREHPFTCRRLLTPLDGSERAEAALPAAHMLAEAFGAAMLLVWILPAPTAGRPQAVEPRTAAPAGSDDEQFARRYLDITAAGLRWGGVAVTTLVARGEPVRAILEGAQAWQADLIVLATHGRTGDPATWAGSVASRLVDQSPRPVLLVRSPR